MGDADRLDGVRLSVAHPVRACRPRIDDIVVDRPMVDALNAL